MANALCGEVFSGYELQRAPCEEYKVRGRKVVIKAMDKFTIRHMRRVGHKENPLREISIMQMLGNDTAHVSGLIEAVEDDTRLYSVMQHFGSELFTFAGKMTEDKVRECFRQIVKGVQALQEASICHRDISLENVLISETGVCTIIDYGLAFVVPKLKQSTITSILDQERGCSKFKQERERDEFYGGSTDEERSNSSMDWFDEEQGEEVGQEEEEESRTSSSSWRDSETYVPVLLMPQGNCGKENYISPEILADSEPFDGMVVDNWSLGVLLFMLFAGRPPFIRASDEDKYFRNMQANSLSVILKQWGLASSFPPAATELLDTMLKAKSPKDRLSCNEILSHPWMMEC